MGNDRLIKPICTSTKNIRKAPYRRFADVCGMTDQPGKGVFFLTPMSGSFFIMG